MRQTYYVLNNPATLTDPSGLCPDKSRTRCVEGGGSGSAGNGGCLLDGMDMSCGSVFDLIQAGAAGQCPINDSPYLQLTADGWAKWVISGFIRVGEDCQVIIALLHLTKKPGRLCYCLSGRRTTLFCFLRESEELAAACGIPRREWRGHWATT